MKAAKSEKAELRIGFIALFRAASVTVLSAAERVFSDQIIREAHCNGLFLCHSYPKGSVDLVGLLSKPSWSSRVDQHAG